MGKNNHNITPRLRKQLQQLETSYGGTLDFMERGELHSWVEAGNSPYSNPEQLIHQDGQPFNFIEWYRSAEWVCEKVCPLEEHHPSDRELFDYFTDRNRNTGSPAETKKYLRDVQSYLGCEILTAMGFLKKRGLLYEYIRYKNAGTEGNLPFD